MDNGKWIRIDFIQFSVIIWLHLEGIERGKGKPFEKTKF